MDKNVLGAYGPWASGLAGEGPARLSFRNPRFEDLEAWRREARDRVASCLLEPRGGGDPAAAVAHSFDYDGLRVEHLTWQVGYGPPTEAIFLKPLGAARPLPAVLALHDHGEDKYFGTRKIAQMSDTLHPLMRKHREMYYGGVSWANALARRGYAVLVHDAFAFGSRRVRTADLPVDAAPEIRPESEEEVAAYNAFASGHEEVMAKSLTCAGTSLPGVVLAEDRRALDYLRSRPDVDPDRVGCGGFSGGGLRAAYLGGLDDRIACVCCSAMMTTWRDLLLNRSYFHSWMAYLPGLAPDLDYSEILGLGVPRPTLVQNGADDPLFTREEADRADAILAEVFAKAGAPGRYRGSFFDGGHQFGLRMQSEAFAWYDRWLKR